jgi:hypothetical protein
MDQEQAKFMLIVKVPRGLVVRDRPAPEAQGALKMRSEPVGRALMAYGIHNIMGVNYARLVPQNPLRAEWVRVAEADHSIEYVDVVEIPGADGSGSIAQAINRLAVAVEKLSAGK